MQSYRNIFEINVKNHDVVRAVRAGRSFGRMQSRRLLCLLWLLCGVILSLSAFICIGAAPVAAQSLFGVSEIRLGIFDHNIETGNDEDGIDVNVELVLGDNQSRYQHSLIDRLFRPDQHIGVSVNMSDDTNVAYAGLTWTLFRSDFMFFEATFGGAVHDGTIKDLVDTSYGCRFSFRESGTIGFNLTQSWELLFTVDHMSNADICDENSGLTNAGVRLGYRLGG